jgi:hypothetical protein
MASTEELQKLYLDASSAQQSAESELKAAMDRAVAAKIKTLLALIDFTVAIGGASREIKTHREEVNFLGRKRNDLYLQVNKLLDTSKRARFLGF